MPVENRGKGAVITCPYTRTDPSSIDIGAPYRSTYSCSNHICAQANPSPYNPSSNNTGAINSCPDDYSANSCALCKTATNNTCSNNSCPDDCCANSCTIFNANASNTGSNHCRASPCTVFQAKTNSYDTGTETNTSANQRSNSGTGTSSACP